jgi:AhpD family alkylhydroperoxidase
MGGGPRIAPGTTADIGRVNGLITRAIGLATGGRPPNVFTTLARHRGLFRRWLLFAGKLMPGGTLPRADTELVILRVAHNCDCAYEWGHHERLGRRAGLTGQEIERVADGPGAAGWTARQALLLRAADQLHATRTLSDDLWGALRPLLNDQELIELCMLIGHYEMLAMTLNALCVEPESSSPVPPAASVR